VLPVVRVRSACRVLVQDAIHELRKLRSKLIEDALEQGGFDVLGGLMQQGIREVQRLRHQRGMHRLDIERRKARILFGLFRQNGDVARIM
jgi:hypothetical protein